MGQIRVSQLIQPAHMISELELPSTLTNILYLARVFFKMKIPVKRLYPHKGGQRMLADIQSQAHLGEAFNSEIMVIGIKRKLMGSRLDGANDERRSSPASTTRENESHVLHLAFVE